MVVAGLVLAAVAAVLHVFIFYLESIVWEGDQARAIFGTTTQEAQVTKSLAFNQGFYNLFLAVLAILGIVVVAAGQQAVGLTLTLAGVGSMAAAAVVLFVSSQSHRRAALRQGMLPILAVAVLTVGILM